MKRIMLLVTVALVMASMLAVSGPASAQGGCKEFGTGVAYNVQNGTLREEIPTLSPVNDDVRYFQGLLCS